MITDAQVTYLISRLGVPQTFGGYNMLRVHLQETLTKAEAYKILAVLNGAKIITPKEYRSK